MDPLVVLTEAQAAELLGLTDIALANHRKRGTAPPHFKIGRAVRYRRNVVIEWIIQQEKEQAA